jgi:hypothetical protein
VIDDWRHQETLEQLMERFAELRLEAASAQEIGSL